MKKEIESQRARRKAGDKKSYLITPPICYICMKCLCNVIFWLIQVKTEKNKSLFLECILGKRPEPGILKNSFGSTVCMVLVLEGKLDHVAHLWRKWDIISSLYVSTMKVDVVKGLLHCIPKLIV